MIQAKRYRFGLAAMTLAVHKRRISRPASGTYVILLPPLLQRREDSRCESDTGLVREGYYQDEIYADMPHGHPRSYGCRGPARSDSGEHVPEREG